MTPAVANFLFEAFNFALLAVVLGWLLFKPVARVLDRERERQLKHDAEQARLRKEAAELLETARAARDRAESETAERRDQVLTAAREEAARLLAEARQTQVSERKALEQELATRRAGEAVALADMVARIAGDSLGELLAAIDGPDLDAALARAACAELEALAPAERDSILVESARALSTEIRQHLEAAVGGAFRERVIPELGAGLRVTTPKGQIDATSRSIARQAARAIAAGEIEAYAVPPGDADG